MLFFGIFLWLLGFILLRKSSLTNDEIKMFKFAKIGDIFTILGLFFIFLPTYSYGKIEIALSFILGTIIILQTHFPLIEDESLYPEEIKNEEFN